MRTLVIGKGAREHALCWALSSTTRVSELYCAPGNAGTAGLARNLPLDPFDSVGIISAVRELGIELVIVGPEAPLAAGLGDALQAANIAVFGPGRKASLLEASKAEARAFCQRHGIPCAPTVHFSPATGLGDLKAYLEANRGRTLVLKKSGLAAGKGVLESKDTGELLNFGEAVLCNDELLAEEYLEGRELSLPVLLTEAGHLPLPALGGHKRALAGDRGPSTGGMGAFSPLPFASPELLAQIQKDIIAPSLEGMAKEGLLYRGVLVFGVMATPAGPRLLDYNVRFGDPETQVLLPRLEGDFAALCAAISRGGAIPRPDFSARYACGVVVAAPGYPISHSRGLPVDLSALGGSVSLGQPGIELGSDPGEAGAKALLFQAATGRDGEGGIRTGGGRCFTAVGLGQDWSKARDRAYEVAGMVAFEGAWFRPDIGDSVFSAGPSRS